MTPISIIINYRFILLKDDNNKVRDNLVILSSPGSDLREVRTDLEDFRSKRRCRDTRSLPPSNFRPAKSFQFFKIFWKTQHFRKKLKTPNKGEIIFF
jgi:hypothetical protein